MSIEQPPASSSKKKNQTPKITKRFAAILGAGLGLLGVKDQKAPEEVAHEKFFDKKAPKMEQVEKHIQKPKPPVKIEEKEPEVGVIPGPRTTEEEGAPLEKNEDAQIKLILDEYGQEIVNQDIEELIDEYYHVCKLNEEYYIPIQKPTETPEGKGFNHYVPAEKELSQRGKEKVFWSRLSQVKKEILKRVKNDETIARKAWKYITDVIGVFDRVENPNADRKGFNRNTKFIDDVKKAVHNWIRLSY